jgi:hypothetical protein
VSIKLNLTQVVFVLIRFVLAVVGLIAVIISLFYGFHLNLLLVIGVMMMIVAGIPYEVSNIKLRILVIVVSITAFILYAYLLTILIRGSLSVKPPVWSDATLLVPLLCLGYVFLHFLMKGQKKK